jgi:hypothetical protein
MTLDVGKQRKNPVPNANVIFFITYSYELFNYSFNMESWLLQMEELEKSLADEQIKNQS